MRWLWWLPLGLVVGLGAMLALRLGWIAATITESDVIETRAAAWVAETGGARTDCHAFPGVSRGIWIVVVCSGRGVRHEYFVNRFGGLEHVERTGP